MKRHMSGLRTDELFPEMRPGTILCEDDDPWIESLPITPTGRKHGVYIRGKIDALVRFDDGSYGVIDFKTSSVAKTSATYSRQLHAYAAALENPSRNSQLEKASVSELGLMVYTPSDFHTPLDKKGKIQAAMTGGMQYIRIDRDNPGFLKFLGEVLDVLDMPEAPPPQLANGRNFSNCSYCNYLHHAHKSGLLLM
ncbi:Exonuclease phage-type/RecB [Gracilaria domingensis]|nr:Exonuclease phage-type/RecB [Gracilaria domingensis]